jgi:FkbM family methyltransferase
MSLLRKLRAHADTALMRWRGCQISSIGGFPVRVHPGDRSFWVDTYFGCWEKETLAWIRSHVRPGIQFGDIGAWVGPTSIFAAKLGAKVTCFEPDPVAYERLLFNLRTNEPGRVAPFNLALGAVDGIRRLAPLAKELGQSGSSLYAPEHKAESARVLALSWTSAVRLLDLPGFDVVKMDIEGGEAELLPDMLPWLRQHRPHLLLGTHWRFIPDEKREFFAETLRELAVIYPRSRGIDMESVRKGFPSLCFEP